MNPGNRSPTLLEAAVAIQRVLGGESLLIGGAALGMWGVDRMTQDIDFASTLRPSTIVELFKNIGVSVDLETGDPDDPVPWVIHGRIPAGDGRRVPFQIVPCLHGIQIENGVSTPDNRVRVVGFDDLVRLKCGAGGPQDLLDIARLALAYPGKIQSIREIAKEYRVLETLDEYLASSRLRDQRSKLGDLDR